MGFIRGWKVTRAKCALGQGRPVEVCEGLDQQRGPQMPTEAQPMPVPSSPLMGQLDCGGGRAGAPTVDSFLSFTCSVWPRGAEPRGLFWGDSGLCEAADPWRRLPKQCGAWRGVDRAGVWSDGPGLGGRTELAHWPV